MTKEEYLNLKNGDIVVHIQHNIEYVVTSQPLDEHDRFVYAVEVFCHPEFAWTNISRNYKEYKLK